MRDMYNISYVEDVDEVVQYDVVFEKLLLDLNIDISYSFLELFFGEQSIIVNVVGFGCKLCSFMNFFEFCEDNNVLFVFVVVKMSEYVVSFVLLVFLCQLMRRFGEEL